MLDFILSKLNLLILVTAIFAIVSFFAISLGDIAKVREAGELTSKIKEQSFSLVNSPNYCFSDSAQLPDELTVSGGTFYYTMKVSTISIGTGVGDSINMLIFSVFPREEVKRKINSPAGTYAPKSIAADSFRTSATIEIFSQEYYDGTRYDRETVKMADGSAYVDPQAINAKNSLEFVKEVVNGKTRFYVIVCNKEAAGCAVAKEKVGKIVHPQTAVSEGGFLC